MLSPMDDQEGVFSMGGCVLWTRGEIPLFLIGDHCPFADRFGARGVGSGQALTLEIASAQRAGLLMTRRDSSPAPDGPESGWTTVRALLLGVLDCGPARAENGRDAGAIPF